MRYPFLPSIAVIVAGIAAPAAAQDTFKLPEGCDAYVTIQSRECTVSHHFTCTGDLEGHQRRVDLGEEAVLYTGMIDAEAQWISSWFPNTAHGEVLEDSPADPASFSELLATGEDTYDFRTLSDEIGPTRYVGRDALTGATEVIDGVTLRQTEYAIVAYGPDGAEVWRSSGNEWVSEEWRMFLSGTSTIITPAETWDSDESPVEFIFPGEPGFLSANPKYDCGLMMSKLEIRP